MWYTILITLAVDIGGLFLIFVLLRNQVRRATSAEAQIAEIREEVSRLLVELNQATDRNVALMEDRIAGLNAILSTADKKIGLLRREIEKHDVGSRIYSRLAEGRQGRAAAPEPLAAVPVAAPQPAPVAVAETAERTARMASGRAVPVAPLAVELSEKPMVDRERPAPEKTGEQMALTELRERIMTLHRSGFSPSLIAGRVGAPLGEVELIISLEQRKGQS